MSKKTFICEMCKERRQFPYFIAGIWTDQLEVIIHSPLTASGHAKEIIENKKICMNCKNTIMKLFK